MERRTRGREMTKFAGNYCHNCGQALDWSVKK
nr:MAG TPA: PROTEIN/RNA Complex, archaeal, ribosomal, 50S, protein.0A [Caudoviricetes sp.]